MAINKLLIAIGFEQGSSLPKLILQNFPFTLELPQAEKFQDLNEILRARFGLQPEFAKLKNALGLPIEDLLREKEIQEERKFESDLSTKFMQRVFALSKEIQKQEKGRSDQFEIRELREAIDLLDQSFDNAFSKLRKEEQLYYLKFFINE